LTSGEHRASQAGLGSSDSLIIPNGRIMDRIAYFRFARNPSRVDAEREITSYKPTYTKTSQY
jgi:hypothetical protein